MTLSILKPPMAPLSSQCTLYPLPLLFLTFTRYHPLSSYATPQSSHSTIPQYFVCARRTLSVVLCHAALYCRVGVHSIWLSMLVQLVSVTEPGAWLWG